MNVSRRSFLSTAAVAPLATPEIIRNLLAAEDYGAKSIPVALQLYTVGADMRKDPAATLAKVAELGFRGVEFAGFPSQDAKEVRKLLDDHELKCCGAHLGMNTLKGDNFSKTVEFAKTIGNTRLIAPSLFRNFSADAEKRQKDG